MKIIYGILLIGLFHSGCTISRAKIDANKADGFSSKLTSVFIEIEGSHKVHKLSKDLGNKLITAFRSRKVEAEVFVREPLALENETPTIFEQETAIQADYKMMITMEDYSENKEYGEIYSLQRNVPYSIKTKKSQWMLTLQETGSSENIWKAIVYISNNNISGNQMAKRVIERLEKDDLLVDEIINN